MKCSALTKRYPFQIKRSPQQILDIFTLYLRLYATAFAWELGEDLMLPLSKLSITNARDPEVLVTNFLFC